MTTKYQLRWQRDVVLDSFRSELHAFLFGAGPPPVRSSPHPAEIIALLRACDYHAPDLLSPADTERLLVGLDRLRSLHAARAGYPVDIIGRHPLDTRQSARCHLHLMAYWHRVAGPRLRMNPARPVESWLSLHYEAASQGIRVGGDLGGEQVRACGFCEAKLLCHIARTAQTLRDGLGTFFALA